MPIYEFICNRCRRRFRRLVRAVSQTPEVACPGCGATDARRQISRFARVRNEDDTLDLLTDDIESAGDSEDPATLRKLMRNMSSGLGEDLEEDFDAVMDEGDGGEDDGVDED